MKQEDMSYVFIAFINGIVVALVAAYVYNIERRMGDISTKLDQTGNVKSNMKVQTEMRSCV